MRCASVLGDKMLAAEDHQVAAKVLKQLLSARGTEPESGIQHLLSLISRKTAVAYGGRRLSPTDYQLIFTQAERFAKWANRIGSQLNIEGWVQRNG